MRRSSVFWGSLLLLFGILLLLNNLGIIAVNIWGVFWPLVLILLGLRLLWGFTLGRKRLESQQLAIPLENVPQADVVFQHGAGRLNVNGQASSVNLLEGDFYGGVESQISRMGSSTNIKLSAPNVFFPWDWVGFSSPQGLTWDVRINPNIPLSLDFRTGASESIIDLSSLKVTDFRLDTGASTSTITFPSSAGITNARIHTGAAALKVYIPQGVAAQIEIKSGMAGINVNQQRFPKVGSVYESPDYPSAANRVQVQIETGVGSVDIY